MGQPEVKFYDHVDDALLKYAVIIAKHQGKWVFCRHRERDTLEIPGGHREPGETILETARRELAEETGASVFTLTQLSPGSRVCILPSGFPALRYSRRAPTYTPLSLAASSTWFGGSFSVPETETPHTKPDICQ